MVKADVLNTRLEADLKRAILEEQFVIHYQPKVDPTSGRIVSAEALIRWDHPEWGIISPEEFIPLAEDTMLIIELGDWVIASVCRQLKRWREQEWTIVPISINVSAKRFLKSGLAANLRASLIENELEPYWIELEITETSLIDNGGSASVAINELRKLGVALSLDDFGTGYSSISYLKKYKVDYLKIDRSFINGIGMEPDDEALIRSMLYLARELNMQVVAEGVETKAQLRFLMKNQCHFIQGYLYSRPLEEKQFAQLLSKGPIFINVTR